MNLWLGAGFSARFFRHSGTSEVICLAGPDFASSGTVGSNEVHNLRRISAWIALGAKKDRGYFSFFLLRKLKRVLRYLASPFQFQV